MAGGTAGRGRPVRFGGGCALAACGDCMACFDGGDGPPSPCVKVCALDPDSGWCVGCGRSASEIESWPRLAAQDKRDVLLGLPERMRRLKALGLARVAP